MAGILGLFKDIPVILFGILVSDKFEGDKFIVSSSGVLIKDVVSLVIFESFTASSPDCNSFYV